MGKIIRNGINYSSTTDAAKNINYDNSASGLAATTAQKAIDELSDSIKGTTINCETMSLVSAITFVCESLGRTQDMTHNGRFACAEG